MSLPSKSAAIHGPRRPGIRTSPQQHRWTARSAQQGERSSHCRRYAPFAPRTLRSPRNSPSARLADEDVPLGEGRVLLEPAVIARLVQLTSIAAGERALVVAAGTGYGAALLAACGARVTALEESASLRDAAHSVLAELRHRCAWSGPLGTGWPQGAPYDVILIEGAVRYMTLRLVGEQLHRQAGRLVTICSGTAGLGQPVLPRPPRPAWHSPMFDCATPLIPSLMPSPRLCFLIDMPRILCLAARCGREYRP